MTKGVMALPTSWSPHQSGAFWLRNGWRYSASVSASGTAADVLKVAPMLIPGGTRFDRVGVRITTTGGGTGRLGIYASHPVSGAPDYLCSDFGTVPETAGTQEITIDWEAGETALYWLAFHVVDETIQATGVHGAGLFKVDAPAFVGGSWGYEVTGQAGLTNPFPVGSVSIIGVGPLLFMRVKSAPPPVQKLKRHRRPQTYWGMPGEDCAFFMKADDTTGLRTITVGPDFLYAVPHIIQQEIQLNTITVSGPTDGVYKAGIYDANDDGYPRRLLWSGSTGAATIWLKPGLYWVAMSTDNAVTSQGVTARQGDEFLQFMVDASGSPTYWPDHGIQISSAGSSLPDPFPQGAVGTELGIATLLDVDPEGRGIINGRNLYVSHHIYHEGWYAGPSQSVFNAVAQKVVTSDGVKNYLTFTLDRETRFDQFWIDVNTVVGSPEVIFRIRNDVESYHSNVPPLGEIVVESASTVVAQYVNRISQDFVLPPGHYHLIVEAVIPGGDSLELRVAAEQAFRFGRAGDLFRDTVVMGLRVAGYGG